MANYIASDIKVELGSKTIILPPPDDSGMTISSEKVWSKDTGRVANAMMMGTPLALKPTLSLKWSWLRHEDCKKIEDAASDLDHPYPKVTYTDMTGKTVTREMYFGTPTYTIVSYRKDKLWVKDVAVDIIAR